MTLLEDTATESEGDGDRIQMSGKCKVYLVGTAHFSVESQNDVRQASDSESIDIQLENTLF